MSPPHSPSVLSTCLPATDRPQLLQLRQESQPHLLLAPPPPRPPEAAFASNLPHQGPSHAVPMEVLNTAASIHVSPAVTGPRKHSPPQTEGQLQDGNQALKDLPCAHGRPISSRPSPAASRCTATLSQEPGCDAAARTPILLSACPGHPSKGHLAPPLCPEASLRPHSCNTILQMSCVLPPLDRAHLEGKNHTYGC